MNMGQADAKASAPTSRKLYYLSAGYPYMYLNDVLLAFPFPGKAGFRALRLPPQPPAHSAGAHGGLLTSPSHAVCAVIVSETMSQMSQPAFHFRLCRNREHSEIWGWDDI
ncbi:hypothetical protein B0H67DRAFT_17426 [Lasiosphaeris hirsuta]|uniref:Uncharacterized protein n=1 Tax=Lasiosphaeris hirsuta TaxID=260670 RepID=A0AA40B958_9PEZI|nr:hypothetical protein B0H67DRAFT_17426 [Lasiosphaeris hirsuta]